MRYIKSFALSWRYVKAVTGSGTGSQTLARGLTALQMVADSPTGLTVQQLAEQVGVHRTIAYRLLSTLVQFRLVAKGRRAIPAGRRPRGARRLV